MKTAVVSDRCRGCGRTIYRGEGCPTSFACDECCKADGHEHMRSLTLKKWISPYYFGSRVIGGVKRFVRRMTAASDLELVPEEDLAALSRELEMERALSATEFEERVIDPDRRTPEEIAADEDFEMARTIAEWKQRNRH